MRQTVRHFRLHQLTAEELGRATRAVRTHIRTLNGLVHDYPVHGGDEIQADADALGLVLVVLLKASEDRAYEDAEKEHLDAS